MGLLMEWIMQIIIFIIIAITIDLLIPTNKMKKYIQLVIGLIFILIFLQPVFYLLQIDPEKEIHEVITRLDLDQENESMEHLINFQKREIQASHDAYILEQMTDQLKAIAKNPLEEHHVEIVDIQYHFKKDEPISYEALEELIVFVQPLDKNKGDQAIKDIVVEIKPSHKNDERKETDQIEKELEKLWELEGKKMSVQWGEGHFEE